MPSGGDGGGQVRVKTRGFTWNDWIVQVVVAIAVPFYLLLVFFVSASNVPLSALARLTFGLVAVAALELCLEGGLSVRAVIVEPSGVTFRYPFHSEKGTWEELSPAHRPVQHGIWYVLRKRPNSTRLSIRWHAVTPEQARAILNFPACPKWDLAESVSRSIGLTAVS